MSIKMADFSACFKNVCSDYQEEEEDEEEDGEDEEEGERSKNFN